MIVAANPLLRMLYNRVGRGMLAHGNAKDTVMKSWFIILSIEGLLSVAIVFILHLAAFGYGAN
jgi:hypothetical protein